jgi:hypothetical protein
MAIWIVTFTHTSRIEADTEDEAKAICTQAVRENVDESECDADKQEDEDN